MSAEDYSVGWTPATNDRGHVEIESPQGTGAVDGHLEAALATLEGLISRDASWDREPWERDTLRAISYLCDAVTHRQNTARTIHPRTIRQVHRDDPRWNCARCDHPEAEHHARDAECHHITLDGNRIIDRCGCPTFTPRSDHA